MDALIDSVNVLASAALAVLLGWAAMSPRVRDGVVIKAGLVLAALGFAATAWAVSYAQHCTDWVVVGRAQVLIHSGAMLIIVGWVMRTRGGRRKLRRTTDWSDLDERRLAPHGARSKGRRS
jgi:RsiW-degrading membrane proteinase PrsW (M82 family)